MKTPASRRSDKFIKKHNLKEVEHNYFLKLHFKNHQSLPRRNLRSSDQPPAIELSGTPSSRKNHKITSTSISVGVELTGFIAVARFCGCILGEGYADWTTMGLVNCNSSWYVTDAGAVITPPPVFGSSSCQPPFIPPLYRPHPIDLDRRRPNPPHRSKNKTR